MFVHFRETTNNECYKETVPKLLQDNHQENIQRYSIEHKHLYRIKGLSRPNTVQSRNRYKL